MRADDITPGWYHAHGNEKADCLIHAVDFVGHEVFLDYTYQGSRRRRPYSKDREWNVTREHVEIAEEIDWVAMLEEA